MVLFLLNIGYLATKLKTYEYYVGFAHAYPSRLLLSLLRLYGLCFRLS